MIIYETRDFTSFRTRFWLLVLSVSSPKCWRKKKKKIPVCLDTRKYDEWRHYNLFIVSFNCVTTVLWRNDVDFLDILVLFLWIFINNYIWKFQPWLYFTKTASQILDSTEIWTPQALHLYDFQHRNQLLEWLFLDSKW